MPFSPFTFHLSLLFFRLLLRFNRRRRFILLSGRFAVFSYSSEGLAAGAGKFFFSRSLAILSALAVSQVCACSEVKMALTLLTYWSCSSLRFALFSAVVVTASLFTACTAST